MADRTVIIGAKFKIVLKVEEGVEIADVMQEMYYDMRSQTDNADFKDTELVDYEILDSK